MEMLGMLLGGEYGDSNRFLFAIREENPKYL